MKLVNTGLIVSLVNCSGLELGTATIGLLNISVMNEDDTDKYTEPLAIASRYCILNVESKSFCEKV